MADSDLSRIASRIDRAVRLTPSGAKRRASMDGLQRWYPYYAGYSLEFAQAVLTAANLPLGASVLDPWNGSGTTTLAAARLNLRGTGVDLNPAAVIIARARLVNCADARGVRGFVQRAVALERSADGQAPAADPLREWLTSGTVAEFRELQRHILSNFANPNGGTPLEVEDDSFPPLAAFLLLALARAAKRRIRARTMSNPTLFRAVPGRRRESRGESLRAAWLATATAMAADLALVASVPADSRVTVGDARRLQVPKESVDFVLTSPPYCTRLDYTDATRFELAALQPASAVDLRTMRRTLMGAPLVRPGTCPDIKPHWPTSIRTLLAAIRDHKSKASESYYYKTYHQYFSDADDALGSIAQTMRRGATAAIVVQSSYYKSIRVDLPALYVDLASQRGLVARVAHEARVRTVLASIHHANNTYPGRDDYRESVVVAMKE